jgi:hypothetical protein
MFVRDILFSEIAVYFLVFFLMSFLGFSVGIFFNSNLLAQEVRVLLHLLVICICVIPFNVIFYENLYIVYAYYLVPPVNFLAERLYYLENGYFLFDFHFFLFVLNAVVYSFVLIVVYNLIMRYPTRTQ